MNEQKQIEIINKKIDVITMLTAKWATKGRGFEDSFDLLWRLGFNLKQIAVILGRTYQFMRKQNHCPVCKKDFELPFRTHYYLKHQTTKEAEK